MKTSRGRAELLLRPDTSAAQQRRPTCFRGNRHRASLAFAVLLAALLAPAQAADLYLELAKGLAATTTQPPVDVGIGNFFVEDTVDTAPFSELLRREMERALPLTERFRVVSRERIAELQKQGNYQVTNTAPAAGRSVLDPGVAVSGLRIPGVKALVRGRF